MLSDRLEAWKEHKLMCKTMRENREESLVAHGARGGQKKVHNDVNRNFTNWFDKVPGLSNEIQLVAWMHRSEAPFISAVASEGDADGSEVWVEMIPRRVCREDPHFVDNSPKASVNGYSRDSLCLPFAWTRNT
mmetsp:Transcript_7609/g.18851  ORF Transcript_7609/g.18851 Transcript_7609/m.18851 type:complete len:133 (-) Transcript_7609:137-535(-)